MTEHTCCENARFYLTSYPMERGTKKRLFWMQTMYDSEAVIITYCPFCGEKLPEVEAAKKWFEELTRKCEK